MRPPTAGAPPKCPCHASLSPPARSTPVPPPLPPPFLSHLALDSSMRYRRVSFGFALHVCITTNGQVSESAVRRTMLHADRRASFLSRTAKAIAFYGSKTNRRVLKPSADDGGPQAAGRSVTSYSRARLDSSGQTNNSLQSMPCRAWRHMAALAIRGRRGRPWAALDLLLYEHLVIHCLSQHIVAVSTRDRAVALDMYQYPV